MGGDAIPVSQLEKMGRELKCPICLGLLDAAVALSCNHVFCNGCILKSMKSGSDCPVCKLPFRRREIRAAPHMDNLVSIYKSMEAASGFNFFATQDAPPLRPDLPAEQKKVGGDADNGRGDSETNCEGGAEYQQSSTLQRSRKCRKSSLGTSGQVSSKPTFPAKKRVLVPCCSLLEATTCHQQTNDGSRESINDGSNGSSMVKEKFVTSEKGELVLSPFFWLRDEEAADISSQDVDEDQLFDLTPPNIPTFSDIKGSDDRTSCEASPTGEVCGKCVVADLYDSEMFEWTQRACSPELLSSPAKANAEGNGIQDRHSKAPFLVSITNEAEFASNTDEMLRNASTTRVTSNLQVQRHKSSNKRKKSMEAVLKKCSKTKAWNILNAPVEVEESENNLREMLPTNKASTSGEKQKRSELLKMKTERVSQKVSIRCQRDHSSASRKRSLELTGIENNEDVYPIGTQKNEDACCDMTYISVPQADQKSPLANGDKPKECHNEVEPSLDSECKRSLRSKKKKVVFVENITEGMLVDDRRVGCSSVSAKETQVTGKFSNISVKRTPRTKGTKRIPLAEVTQAEADATNKGKTATSVRCVFCHSSEASEASGEMVHYYNGRAVALNYNGGSKLLHCHKNCAEWAPNVYFKDDVAVNLEAEIARSRKIKCSFCGLKGAALGCYDNGCRRSFHVTCAKLTPQCRWDNDNFVMLCPLHRSSKLPNEGSASQQTKIKKRIPRRPTPIQHISLNSNQGISPSQSWDPNIAAGKLVVCCSALAVEERDVISKFEKLSKIAILKKWDSSVTHVVASTDNNGACRRTLKVLMGILEGKWILNIEWVKACMKAMKFVEEDPYEITADIHGIREGPRQGRMRLMNEQPKIFQGLNFYLMGDFVASYKGYLQDLVTAGGGTVLHRKPISRVQQAQLKESSVASFIIYSLELPEKHDLSKKSAILTKRRSDAEALATSMGAKAVSNMWVLNSIAACKLQSLSE